MRMLDFSEIGRVGPFTIIGDRNRISRCVGLINKKRDVVLSPDMGYESFIDYHDGLIIANKPTKNGPGWMLIDYLGNPITPEGYTFITYAEEDCYKVEKGSRHNIMRRNGTFVLKEWPHRVSKVYNGYFTFGKTIRKTKSTPTRYVEGLAHINGTVVFPMVFDSLIPSEGAVFSAKYDGKPYVVHGGAVFDPAKKHYPVLRAASTMNEILEKSVNWILPGLQFFYRDTDAEIDVESQYPVGKTLRSGFFVDMSTKLLKPAKKTRFIIAAAHAALLCGYETEDERQAALQYSPEAEEWRHAVLHKNTWLKVMDVYKAGGVTQILLLQIPETAAKFFGDEPEFFKFINDAAGDGASIIEYARNSLDEKLHDIVHPRSLDTKFVERMSQPIGYDSDGEAYSISPDLRPYDNDINLMNGTPGLFYSRYIHLLAKDRDIIREFESFPWRGVVGSFCEGCIYAEGTNDKPFGCGRLFEKKFRTNYINGRCNYFKNRLQKESLFEYRSRCELEKASKKSGHYAKRLLREFIDEKLNGNIEDIASFDFCSLKGDSKYGCLRGPDIVTNFAIIKAIMEVVFGEHWPNLNVDTLDVYTFQTGTIINDHRLVGSRLQPRNFKFLTRFEDNSDLRDMAEVLHALKPTLGNFLVWPNKAVMHSIHDSSKLRGYIDRTFIGMYEVASGAEKQNMDIAAAMYKNRELMKDYQGIDGFHRFMKVSLLEDFLDENGVPQKLFDGISNSAKDFNPTLLPSAVKQYHDFMAPFIRKRTRRIIEILKTKI